jgi:hypothetical protein
MNLSVMYTDGRIVRVNLSDVAERLQAFASLEAPHEFAPAQITDFGWSLEWNCGASLDSDRVLELAMEQAGMAENVRFRQWQDAHHLSLAEAAKAIGQARMLLPARRVACGLPDISACDVFQVCAWIKIAAPVNFRT